MIESVLLHRNERSDISATDWARLLGLDQFLAAVLADAEVAARHYQGVLRVAQANEALGLWVVVDHLLAVLGAFLARHAVDGFQFEGQAVDLRKTKRSECSERSEREQGGEGDLRERLV